MKNFMVEIEFKTLERIAKFYGFPVAVFLVKNSKIFKTKTREEYYRKQLKKIRKITLDVLGPEDNA